MARVAKNEGIGRDFDRCMIVSGGQQGVELVTKTLIDPEDVVLVEELSNEDSEDEWVFPLEADTADLKDIVRTVFVLNLDSKLLCKPDCKGLCFRCGRNLNDGTCDCRPESDPRLAVLGQLLKDMKG